MSILFCANINKKSINNKKLKKFIIEFFSPKHDLDIRKNGTNTEYNYVCDENEIIIVFSSVDKPPYNIYDSSITNGEYEYEQSIIFDIYKEYGTTENFIKIIKFCIYVRKKIKSDILLTSDLHNDICLLKKDEIIWSDKLRL